MNGIKYNEVFKQKKIEVVALKMLEKNVCNLEKYKKANMVRLAVEGRVLVIRLEHNLFLEFIRILCIKSNI